MNIKTKKSGNKIFIDVVDDNVNYGIVTSCYNADDGKTHIAADSIDARGFPDSALAKKQIIRDLEKNHDIIVDFT